MKHGIKKTYRLARVLMWAVFVVPLLVMIAVLIGTNIHRCEAQASPMASAREIMSTSAEKNHRELKIQNLVNGILTTHPRMVTRRRARTFATHALATVTIPKYKWLPPEFLLAVAANESDFRPQLICENGRQDPGGWDCGPLQTRVTVFHGRTRRARKLCKRLTTDIGLAMRYAAREMTGYKGKYCRGLSSRVVKVWKRGSRRPIFVSKFWRCILNAYNQGPRYFREELCGSAKCELHSRYWIRVACWANGIATGRKIKWPNKCRKARSLRWITKAYQGRMVLFKTRGRPGRKT